jgi:hypothetical protein
MRFLVISLLGGIIYLSGCGSKKINNENKVSRTQQSDQKPFWISDPQTHLAIQGKIYGLGYSRDHIHGNRAKRQLAISTAINEIANQKGVKVNSELEMFQKGGESVSSPESAIQLYSVQTVEGKTVNAKIIESWEDPNTKELWILMAE